MQLIIRDKPVNVDRRQYDRDTVTRKHTAFNSFHALVNAGGCYRPSIYLGDKPAKHQRELLFLSFEYNIFQHSRKDARRVYKADWRPANASRHPILSERLERCAVPGCDMPARFIEEISINNEPKRAAFLCRQHRDAAKEDADAADAQSTHAPTQMQITNRLARIGADAVLAHKRARLYASVNSEDNFTVAMWMTAYDAMGTKIGQMIDHKVEAVAHSWIDWYNHAVTTPARNPTYTCFDAVAMDAARIAYKTLRQSQS